jgi:hypothetical protein
LTVRERSNTVTETGIAFFSAGGHSHDGINSSIIDTTKYSIFDFNFGLISTNSARINNQTKNERAFRDFIMKVINQSVLEPAGVVLQDNIINARNIIAGSITADEIAANTITANNIAANTITSNNIAAGTITGDLIAAGTITADLIAAGVLVTDEIFLNNGDFWSSNGSFRLGGVNGITYGGSGSIGIGSSVVVSGVLAAIQGSIGGWSVTLNSLSAGNTTLFSNGVINASIFRTTASTQGFVEVGTNLGSGHELRFISSNGGVGSIRNDQAGNNLRLSAGKIIDIRNDSITIGGPTTLQGDVTINGTNVLCGSGSSGLDLRAGSHFRSRTIYDTTTSSAANMFIADSPHALFRTTSSIIYKTDVEDIEEMYAKKVLGLRPVWYRSLCEHDPDDYSYYGFIAEEVAEVDPRLVHWASSRTTGFTVDDYGEQVEIKTEGPFPEGVQYDRLTPHIVYLLKDLYSKIDYLENFIKGE